MNIQIREYKDSDIQEMNRIWNRVVDDGVAFPQEDDLTEETGRGFFARPDLYCGGRGYRHRKGARTLYPASK